MVSHAGFRRIVLITSWCVASLAAHATDYGNGVHAYFSGDYGTALQRFDAAIRSTPDDPRSRYFRGLTHSQLGNRDAAKADFADAAGRERADQRVSVGMALQRVQGPARLELERYRRQARQTQQQKPSPAPAPPINRSRPSIDDRALAAFPNISELPPASRNIVPSAVAGLARSNSAAVSIDQKSAATEPNPRGAPQMPSEAEEDRPIGTGLAAGTGQADATGPTDDRGMPADDSPFGDENPFGEDLATDDIDSFEDSLNTVGQSKPATDQGAQKSGFFGSVLRALGRAVGGGNAGENSDGVTEVSGGPEAPLDVPDEANDDDFDFFDDEES